MHTMHIQVCTQLAAQTNTERKCSSHMITHSASGLIPLTLWLSKMEAHYWENIYKHVQCGSIQH